MRGVVSIEWLREHLDDENLIILDASQSISVNELDGSLSGKYIPGTVSFNLKSFSDQNSDLPNTFPTPEYFQEQCRSLGINKDSKLVIYDNQGVYFSPRVWWMFHAMSHEYVSVLDGGLPAWIAQNEDVETTTHTLSRVGDFEAILNPGLVKTYNDVLENIAINEWQVIDARSKGRFDGTAPEPREGLKSGHIPNSKSLPFKQVLNGHSLKPEKDIAAIFEQLDTEDKELVFSCGSGLTACIITLAKYRLTGEVSPVYDGSWTEWAQQESSPINQTN